MMSKNGGKPKYMKGEDGRKPLNKLLVIAGIGLGCCLLAVLGVLAVKAVFPPDSIVLSSSPAQESSQQPSSTVEEASSTDPVSSEPEEPSSAAEESRPVSSAEEPEAVPSASATAPVKQGDFSDALFIGDSRTEALNVYGVVQGASFLSNKGLAVNTIFTKASIRTGSGMATVADALRQEPQHKREYIMLGINDLGWPSMETFTGNYSKLIDAVRSSQPNATIYVQSILPVSKKKSDSDPVINNANINRFNEQIQKMAEEKGAVYLEVNKALMDSAGALPAGAATDGIHPNVDYCRKWAEYLKANVK